MNFFNPLMLSALGFDLDNGMTFAERISMGLQVLVFGMAVVFSVLVLLWGTLEIFRVIFYEIPKRKKEKPVEKPVKPAEEPVAKPVEMPSAAPIITDSEPDDAELVAAITAAISVVMDKPQTSFRVVSFRRTASK